MKKLIVALMGVLLAATSGSAATAFWTGRHPHLQSSVKMKSLGQQRLPTSLKSLSTLVQ
jgi:hypothetical protein